MEKLIDLLKPLIEKYLFTTILSVALAILGVVLLPDVLNLKEQVGQFVYGLLLFCICFLVISLIKYIYLKFKHAFNKKISDEQHYRVLEAEQLEELWNYVDSLSPLEKKYLFDFLKNKNKPIKVESAFFTVGLLSKYLVSTDKIITPDSKINTDTDFKNFYNNYGRFQTYKLIKLRDDFYKLLKYSYDKYGKISHFEGKENLNGQDEDAHAE